MWEYPKEIWASLVAQMVKILPAMWETWDQSLGWENPLEKEQLPTPVFWPGEFHGLYSPWDRKELDTTERLSLFILIRTGRWLISCITLSLNTNTEHHYQATVVSGTPSN